MQYHFGPWQVAQKTDKPLPAAPVVVEVDPAIYATYAGEYQIAPDFSLVISVEGDKLIVTPTGQDPAELFPESETRFFVTVIDAQVEFQRDAAGQVTGLAFIQGGQAFPGRKIK
jgi:hypothetical protein